MDAPIVNARSVSDENTLNKVAQVVSKMRRRARISRITGIVFVIILLLFGLIAAFTFLARGGGSTDLRVRVFGSQFEMSRRSADISPNADPIVQSLIDIGLNVSSVLIAIFIIQILVGFARYSFRIADHVEARADAIDLCREDISKFTEVIASFSSETINFSKMPSAPIESISSVLKELSSSLNAMKPK